MSYAVKIGEIILKSDEPITPEERRRAVRDLSRLDGTETIDTVDFVDMAIVVMRVSRD